MKGVTAIVAWAIWLLCIAGCQKADQTAARPVEQVVDSIVERSMPALQREAAEDLDRRRAIEVRVKRDSIVQQSLRGAAYSPTPSARPPLP